MIIAVETAVKTLNMTHNGGDNFNMTDLNEAMDKQPVPESEVLMGQITDVELTTRGEAIPPSNFDGDEYPYDDWREDDRVARVTVSYAYEGESYTYQKVFTAPESYTPGYDIAKFEKQYGKLPAEGMDVQLSFDSDGQASIVLAD